MPSRWIHASTPYLRPQAEGRSDAWTEEAAQQGGVGSTQLREVAQLEASPDVAADLGLDPGQSVVVRRRLVLLNDKAVELADSYYPVSIAQGTPLAQTGKIRGGAVTLLAELGYTAHSTIETIRARPATVEEARLLNLQPADWVLVLRRVIKDHRGVPFETSEMTMVAHDRELRYELQEEG
ncbi:UTRA domain-containing protein [Actinomadura sp. ATCC 39365]